MEAQQPSPEPTGPSQAQIDFGARVAAAVSALRLHSERLAEHAQKDAVELALLLARRLVEGELGAGIEPLLRVVKGVVRRAGESRRVVVHLCPADAANVEQAGGPRGLTGVGAAQIDLVVDPNLGPGDCVVDADFGTIDARLDTRFAELRRLLDEAVAGGER
jgi:flagellar assembly protein FliH